MSDDKKKNMYDPKDNFFQDDKTVQKIKKINEELAEIMIVEEL